MFSHLAPCPVVSVCLFVGMLTVFKGLHWQKESCLSPLMLGSSSAFRSDTLSEGCALTGGNTGLQESCSSLSRDREGCALLSWAVLAGRVAFSACSVSGTEMGLFLQIRGRQQICKA